MEVKLSTVGDVPSEYVGERLAAPSVVAGLPARSTENPAATSIVSAVSVVLKPSAANPTVASKAVAAAEVSFTVNTVALVTFAESISERTKVFPGVAASSASKSSLA